MDDKHIRTENDLLAEVHERLVCLGIDADLIRDDVWLARAFSADVVVIDKFSRQPLMAFELKILREGRTIKPPFHIGNFAGKTPYYLIVYDQKAKACWIARMKSEEQLSASVDWDDKKEVNKLLLTDFAAAKGFVKGMHKTVNALCRVKKFGKTILRFWLPLIMLASLAVHIWLRPLTWEMVAYYGILVIVGFVGSGIPIHLKYRDLEAIVGQWRDNAINETGRIEDCHE